MVDGGAIRQIFYQTRDCGGTRLRTANVVGPGLVIPSRSRHQSVPIERPEHGPGGDGADICTACPRALSRIPGLYQPAELIFPSRIDMAFGDRERQAKSVPGFEQQVADVVRRVLDRPCHLDVRILVAAIAAVKTLR